MFNSTQRGLMFRGFGLPTETPPYAGTPTQQMTPGAVPQAEKPGFFSKGGMGLNLLGGIADGIATAYGGKPVFAAYQLQDRERQQKLEDRIAERKAATQEWIQQQIWQREHPAPINNDTVNDYNFIAGKLGEDAANQYLRNMGDPMVTVPLGQDRIYAGPRSGLGGALGAGAAPAPQRPGIGSVIADPRKGGSGSGQNSFR